MIIETTITVIVQPYSWISNTLEMPDEAGSVINKKVKAGTSLNSLLVELANSYPEFRNLVFDPETGKMSDQALIILNSKLIQYGEINEIILNDKDNVTLAPVIFGG